MSKNQNLEHRSERIIIFTLLVVLLTTGCTVTLQEDQVEDNNGIIVRKTTGEPFTGQVRGVWHWDLPYLARYKDGLLHGRYEMWHENGETRTIAYYRHGKLHGKHAFWDENGQPSTESEYRDGKRHGFWTQWYFGTNMKNFQREYKNDVLDGCSTEWDREGNKVSEIHYRDGVRHGPSVSWHANGMKASEDVFEMGVLQGERRRWHPDGSPVQELQTVFEVVAPIEVLWGGMLFDGGSIGIHIQDSNRKELFFTLDGRIYDDGIRTQHPRFGIGATGPDDALVRWLPYSGEEETHLLGILNKWLKESPVPKEYGEARYARHLVEEILERKQVNTNREPAESAN